MKRLQTDALWMAVDEYCNDLLVQDDPALDAALQATEEAGLPPSMSRPTRASF